MKRLFTIKLFTREYNKMLDEIKYSDLDNIFKLTNCVKPCKYKRYQLIGEKKPSLFQSDYVAFSLWAVSENTKVSTEHLVYPFSALIADFGGTLGLFLGISFIGLWDLIHLFAVLFYKIYFKGEHLIDGGEVNPERKVLDE